MAPPSSDSHRSESRDARPAIRRLHELATLNAVLDLLNHPADPNGATDAPLEQALARLADLVGARAGWLFVSTAEGGDSHRGGFRVAARHGLPPALSRDAELPLRCGGCDCQARFRSGRLERGVNIVECSRLASAEGDRRGLELHASVPLIAPSGPVGIANLAAPGNARFDEPTLALLAAAGKAMGTALERQRLERRRTLDARYAATLEARQRLAQEMHDAVSQQLFAAQLALETLRAAPPGDVGALRAGLERVGAGLADAQRDVRALVETLRPAELGGGLGDALTRLAERVGADGAPGRPSVHLDLDAPDPAPPAADAAYRVAQEALSNALRHAGARHVWLRWRRIPGRPGGDPAEPAGAGRLELIVDDDGRGLPSGPAGSEASPHPDSDPVALGNGLGVPGMRRRAREVGAVFEIGAAPAGGARVRLVLPEGAASGPEAEADSDADAASDTAAGDT